MNRRRRLDQATGHFRGFKIFFVGPSWKSYICGWRCRACVNHSEHAVVQEPWIFISFKQECRLVSCHYGGDRCWGRTVHSCAFRFTIICREGSVTISFCAARTERYASWRDVYALLKFTNVVVRTLVRSCSKGSLKTAGRSQGWEPKHTESASLLCRPGPTLREDNGQGRG